ncbi:MAG: hypothetical protein H7A46_19990 [Verrucomicrobiales bacterium]|nr:hypothetical protein [Verrucomicrobiales bacterium]
MNIRCHLVVGLSLGLVLSLPHCRAELLLEYTFDDSGPSTQATERALRGFPLQFENQDGSPADWHGAPGSGVSGRSEDRAFDNTASTGMGTGSEGGRAHGKPVGLEPMDSITLSGWFRTVDQSLGVFARLVWWDFRRQVYSYPDAGLHFAIDTGVYVGSDAAYTEVNEWVFWAVTYDGTQNADNVKFWKGTRDTGVSLVSTRSLPAGQFAADYPDFMIGNNDPDSSPTQPLDGWIDNVRLHGGDGNSGILGESELEALRAQDVAGDLPPIRIRTELEVSLESGPPAGLTFGWWTIEGHDYQLQESANLSTWSDVAAIATAGDGTRQERSLTPLPTSPRFYRLKVSR